MKPPPIAAGCRKDTPAVTILRLWVWLAAGAAVAGWILSWLGCLTPLGWAVAAALGAAAFAWLVAACSLRPAAGVAARMMARFRRPAAACFAVLACLALIGGILYAPSNHDALSYRVPRVLHWLAEHRWHWIGTEPASRLNYSGTGFEWLMCPFLAWFRSDRGIFAYNWIAFLLLPGLIFSVFRGVGIGGRAARAWMWLLPAGYGYALQAGSAANDAIAATHALASVMFALRFQRHRHFRDFATAVLAASVLTGIKSSNLPLVLPCALILAPALGAALRRPVLAAALVPVAILASALPILWLNQRHAGHWTGEPNNESLLRIANPAAGLVGNGLMIVTATVAPPVLPVNGARVRASLHALLPDAMHTWLKREFPRFGWPMGELQTEEGAGLGIGIGVAAVAMTIGALRLGRGKRRLSTEARAAWVVAAMVSAWVAAGVYGMKMGTEGAPRLLAPYYPLMLPLLLAPGGAGATEVTRRVWWRFAAGFAVACALIVVVLAPARPLFPALTLCDALIDRGIKAGPVLRAREIFAVYRARNDALAPVRALLPPESKRIGFLDSGGDLELALWKPLGSGRRVVRLGIAPTLKELREQRIEVLVFPEKILAWPQGAALAQIAASEAVTDRGAAEVTQLARVGPERWRVLELRP